MVSIRLLPVLAAPLWAAAAETPSFEDFLAQYGLSYPESELPARRALYQQRAADITAQNSKEGRLWTAGVNEMAAATDEELARLRGHRAAPRSGESNATGGGGGSGGVPSLRGQRPLPPPRLVDWRRHLPAVVTAVKDQGSCGSCWAFATAEVVESHVALRTGVLMDLAPQQVASCAPPLSSGSRGCDGSNAAVGLGYVAKAGIDSQWHYPYLSGITGQTGQCLKGAAYAKRGAGITGFNVIPANSADAMMRAVAQHGPIAVVVAAESWHFYASGVFDACGQGSVKLDHAVVLMGYGEAAMGGHGLVSWWLVRNSWGATWGEGGYIRPQRFPSGEPCGSDQGMRVCGECGVLFNGAHPTGGFLSHAHQA